MVKATERMDSKSVERRRAAMPETSAFIDLCRQAYGAALVDQQLKTAQQARRDYVAVLHSEGEVAARQWHRANAHRCTFYANEGGRVIGLPSPFGASHAV